MRTIRQAVPVLLILPISITLFAQKKHSADAAPKLKDQAIQVIQSKADTYKKNAMDIWGFAEVGYKEVKSSALHRQTLKDNGFWVDTGVAEIPTAFVATYGTGKPVIGILAEYDALPGMSQEAIPEKKAVDGKKAGHACGHHLFGTASIAAGTALKKLIEEKKISGTIKVFGCPAEEGGSGKVYMVRAGLFNDVDAVIHWHPADDNEVTMTSALANKSAKFRFKGIAAHASSAPDKGRSSLDAVEALNMMANMMREHIPQEARLHYVITNGGKAPNIVPDFAEVYYYIRHPRKEEVKAIFERIVKAAQGAALGTETTMEYEVIGGTHDLLLNKSLAEVMQKNLDRTGGVVYTPAEIEFAEKIQSSFTFKAPAIENAAKVKPLKAIPDAGGGSTDVGDVSYAVPTVGIQAATWVPGTPAHSWQAVAAGGTDIGIKGMMVAAKAMAMTAIDLYIDPTIITKATEEFKSAKGNYKYEALLGDRKPALNYRD